MTTEEIRALIAKARRMAPFYDRSGTLEVTWMLTDLADALEATLPAHQAPEPGTRLDPEFRAVLVDIAAGSIQDVWNDVPSGVDAETLAQNVVGAQEFAWIARGFPVGSKGENLREIIGRALYEAERAGATTGEYWISWERLVEKDQELSDEKSAKYGSEKYRLLADAALAAFPGLGREGDTIPLYGMLDLWQALYGTSHPEFEEFYAEHGYAETWARLLAEVRSRAAGLGRDIAAEKVKWEYATAIKETNSEIWDYDRCSGTPTAKQLEEANEEHAIGNDSGSRVVVMRRRAASEWEEVPDAEAR